MASQTGSIDLTASNSVKLAAEAGWQSDLDSYYTKSEIDVTVGGINTEVSKKVNGTEIISTINQSAESVSINANKINLQGAVTISDLSSDAQSATLNSNISVGGRNLLAGTGDWSGWFDHLGEWVFSGDVATSAVKSSLQWGDLNSNGIPLEDCYGKTFTISFDYRSDSWGDSSGVPYVYINVKTQVGSSATASRKKYRRIDASRFTPTTEWQRGTITFTVGSDESWFTSGTAGGSYMAVQFYNYSLNQLQLRHVKLEVGNVATDWNIAIEDVGGEAQQAAYQTAKPNLTPFFEHDLKDVYNATTNPTGYWNGGGGDYVSGSSTFATAMENGWVHINRTNSGTSTMSTYIRPFANGRTLDDGDYTFLVEFRNVESMPTTSYMYTQQGTDVQIWGNHTYGGFTINNADIAAGNQSYQAYYKPVQLLGVSRHGTTGEKLVHVNWYIPAGGTVTCDLRLSIYEGNYTGPWKSYVDSELTARMKTAEAGISNAAKTATSYVTDIDSNGITVHPSRSDYATNGGRAVINADGLTVYLGSDDVASYGVSARIGKSNSDRVTVDSTNGITIYKGNSKRLQTTANGIDVYGSDGTTSIASFGSTARIGKSNGTRVIIDTSEVKIIPSNKTSNALTFTATDDSARIDYGSNYLSIGDVEFGYDCALGVLGDVWVSSGGSLNVGSSAAYGNPKFTVTSGGSVRASGAIYATDDPTDTSDPSLVAGLVGTSNFIVLRADEGGTGNRWRFNKAGRDIGYYNGTDWDTVCPMPAMTAAISGQTDKSLTTSYANLTLAAVTTVASALTISGGGVKCTKAGRVMISGAAYFEGVSAGNVCNIRVLIGSTIAAFVSDRAYSDRCQMVIPPRITTVDVNDVLYMAVANTSDATGSVKGTRTQTWLTVQYVAYN